MLQAADIICVRGEGFFSRAIMRFNSDMSGPAIISHVGLAICDRHIIEALGRGVVTSAFPHAFTGKEYAIYRPLNLDILQIHQIVHRALAFSARRYGWTKIAGQYLDYVTDTNFFTSRIFTWDRYPICSFVVAEAYAAAGKTFGVPQKSTVPCDILDFCVKNPDKFKFVEATKDLFGLLKTTPSLNSPASSETVTHA